MDKFEVSVVIPVYNCEKFLIKAIESVLIQNEVKEIILIEDKSPDNALQICLDYSNKYKSKIKLLRHKKGINKGAAASRNLGMKNVKYPFVAFLDGDDFYLPNRFLKTKEVFYNKKDADGVYEAVESFFYSEDVKKNWLDFGGELMTTMNEIISPKLLFEFMGPNGNRGTFHCNGLTLKRNVFENVGFFDREIIIEEDTMYFLKLAAACILYPGNIKTAVAMRGVHENNRVSDFQNLSVRSLNRVKSYTKLSIWSIFSFKQKWIIRSFLNSLNVTNNEMKSNHGQILNFKYKFYVSLLLLIKKIIIIY